MELNTSFSYSPHIYADFKGRKSLCPSSKVVASEYHPCLFFNSDQTYLCSLFLVVAYAAEMEEGESSTSTQVFPKDGSLRTFQH